MWFCIYICKIFVPYSLTTHTCFFICSVILSNFALLPFLCLIKRNFPALNLLWFYLSSFVFIQRHSLNFLSPRYLPLPLFTTPNRTFALFSTFASCLWFFACNLRQRKNSVNTYETSKVSLNYFRYSLTYPSMLLSAVDNVVPRSRYESIFNAVNGFVCSIY